MEIAIVGLGGTGSWLYPMLLKEINTRCRDKRYIIALYDPDTVQERNIINQNFFVDDIGKYKVEVLMERYVDYYAKDVDIIARREKIGADFIPSSILISCVDNNETRQELNRNNIKVWIDVGNGDSYGQAVIINHKSKRNGEKIGSIIEILPDFALPTPAENTCNELPPNNWWINKMAANVVMILLRKILDLGYEFSRDINMSRKNIYLPILTTFEMGIISRMYYKKKDVLSRAEQIREVIVIPETKTQSPVVFPVVFEVGDKVKVIRNNIHLNCHSSDGRCCEKYIGLIGTVCEVHLTTIGVNNFPGLGGTWCSGFSPNVLELVERNTGG